LWLTSSVPVSAEKKFAADESVNVKSALDYLVKMDVMVKVEKI